MKKIILFICLIIFLISFSIGKSYVDVSSFKEEENYSKEETIYSIDSFPSTLDSKENLTKGEEDLICNIFSGLVELNEAGEPIPDLAIGWSISSDFLEYTFKIKEDNKWSNGENIKAQDFQEFFRNLLSPENKNYKSEELYAVYGVKDYREGRAEFSDVAIKATDDSTLVFRMNHKDEDFLKKLGKPIYRLRDFNEPLNSYKDSFKEISYTGPYILEEIREDGLIKLRDNPYNSSELEIETLSFKEKEDEEIELASFNLSKIDILKNPPIIYSGEMDLYKESTKYTNGNLKLMIINSHNYNFIEEIKNIMGLIIGESPILKNNIGNLNIKNLKNKEDLKFIKDNSLKDGEEIILEKNKIKESALRNLKDFKDKGKEIKIIIEDKSEDKLLGEGLKAFLEEELNIKTSLKIYEKNLDEKIKEGNFTITFKEIDLKDLIKINENYIEKEKNNEENTEENMGETLEEKKENKVTLNYISLYFKKDIWFKSPKVKYLFIDALGNLIFKYSN